MMGHCRLRDNNDASSLFEDEIVFVESSSLLIDEGMPLPLALVNQGWPRKEGG